jgi:sortase A
VRVIVRSVSELCITVGALIVLFVVYVLFWTGVKADHTMSDQIDQLQTSGRSRPRTRRHPRRPPPPRSGETGRVQGRQALRDHVHPAAWFHVEQARPRGHRREHPQEGARSLRGTARLGQVGNFAVAGHRRTYGDPFVNFPKLRAGDAVVLTDGTTWFTYRIDKGPYKTVPTDIEVIDPVPRKSGYTASGRYLTLTTCDPEWGHSHRLIVWAHLDSTQPVEAGKPAALRR